MKWPMELLEAIGRSLAEKARMDALGPDYRERRRALDQRGAHQTAMEEMAGQRLGVARDRNAESARHHGVLEGLQQQRFDADQAQNAMPEPPPGPEFRDGSWWDMSGPTPLRTTEPRPDKPDEPKAPKDYMAEALRILTLEYRDGGDQPSPDRVKALAQDLQNQAEFGGDTVGAAMDRPAWMNTGPMLAPDPPAGSELSAPADPDAESTIITSPDGKKWRRANGKLVEVVE